MSIKSFITLAPGPNVIKLFTAVKNYIHNIQSQNENMYKCMNVHFKFTLLQL
jgi:hypothetical protein